MPVSSPKNPWKVSPEEAKKRLDLRDTHLIFSIDPKGCEDVDDALSVRTLPNGNLELGVHIADVTHFVAANSYTDVEARARQVIFWKLENLWSSEVCDATLRKLWKERKILVLSCLTKDFLQLIKLLFEHIFQKAVQVYFPLITPLCFTV